VNTEITDVGEESGGRGVFYDADCPVCSRWAVRAEPFLARKGFRFRPLQSDFARRVLRLPLDRMLEEMRVVGENGAIYGGADAFVFLARCFPWSRPVAALAGLPGMRPLLRRIYRHIASHRLCDAGHCDVSRARNAGLRSAASVPNAEPATIPKPSTVTGRRGSPGRGPAAAELLRSKWIGWTPLLVLTAAALAIGSELPSWAWMWLIAFALFAGCKWLSLHDAIRGGSTPDVADAFKYLFGWVGMDARSFLDRRSPPAPVRPTEWLFAAAKCGAGAILIWGIARHAATPMLAVWTGMIGLVFLLHFGVFHLLTLAWRRAGRNVEPLMCAPILARSLTELWARRWNTAFHRLAVDFVLRPSRGVVDSTWAGLLVFAVSGLVHDLVLSMPVHGGYGLPTLYFLIQGAGVTLEKSNAGRRLALGRGFTGRCFTVLVAAAPLGLLLHPTFLRHAMLPFLQCIGAL
jgi:predicted DCC family thiol-disulfide oxidoreductase YuxK